MLLGLWIVLSYCTSEKSQITSSNLAQVKTQIPKINLSQLFGGIPYIPTKVDTSVPINHSRLNIPSPVKEFHIDRKVNKKSLPTKTRKITARELMRTRMQKDVYKKQQQINPPKEDRAGFVQFLSQPLNI